MAPLHDAMRMCPAGSEPAGEDEVADDDTLVDPSEYEPGAVSLKELLRQQQQVRGSSHCLGAQQQQQLQQQQQQHWVCGGCSSSGCVETAAAVAQSSGKQGFPGLAWVGSAHASVVCAALTFRGHGLHLLECLVHRSMPSMVETLCASTYTCSHTHTYTYSHIHTSTHKLMHTCVRMHASTHIHTHAHAHTRTHILTHTNTHSCIHLFTSPLQHWHALTRMHLCTCSVQHRRALIPPCPPTCPCRPSRRRCRRRHGSALCSSSGRTCCASSSSGRHVKLTGRRSSSSSSSKRVAGVGGLCASLCIWSTAAQQQGQSSARPSLQAGPRPPHWVPLARPARVAPQAGRGHRRQRPRWHANRPRSWRCRRRWAATQLGRARASSATPRVLCIGACTKRKCIAALHPCLHCTQEVCCSHSTQQFIVLVPCHRC